MTFAVIAAKVEPGAFEVICQISLRSDCAVRIGACAGTTGSIAAAVSR
jgi:hypothetical protein